MLRLNLDAVALTSSGVPPGSADDFNDNSIDPNGWFVTLDPSGTGTIIETNQRLEMLKTQSGSGYLGLASKCKVQSDFDVQVDFTLLNWPMQNFHTVRLMASDLPEGPLGKVGVYRNSYNNGENYQMRAISGVVADVTRTDFSGKLRLIRTGYDHRGTILEWCGVRPHRLLADHQR